MRTSTVLAIVLLTVASAAHAQPAPAPQPGLIVVAEPLTVGIDPSSATTFADLVRVELGKRGGMRVVPRSATPPEPCGDVGCAVGLAQRTGASAAVATTLSRLGDRVIVKIEYAGADGQVLMTDRATAASLNDLDPLSTRVALAISTGRPIDDTATTTTVTQQESRDAERKRAVATAGIHIGAFAPVGDSYGGSSAMADLGLFAFLELHSFAAVAELEFMWTLDKQDDDPKAFGFQFNLGGRYFIDPEADTGVYLGGGLGFRVVSVDLPSSTLGSDDSRAGVGLYGGAGIVFLRTSDIHIILDARYDVNLFSLDNVDDGAHGLMISLGLSYTKWGRWL